MEEGLNLNLVLNGATLLSVLGLGVKVYLAGKTQKVGPQPFEVRHCQASTEKAQCDERHKLLNDQVTCLFARTELQGKQQSALAATQEAVEKQLASMDNKLDKLIARKG
jgi:uncharacterized protein HemX